MYILREEGRYNTKYSGVYELLLLKYSLKQFNDLLRKDCSKLSKMIEDKISFELSQAHAHMQPLYVELKTESREYNYFKNNYGFLCTIENDFPQEIEIESVEMYQKYSINDFVMMETGFSVLYTDYPELMFEINTVMNMFYYDFMFLQLLIEKGYSEKAMRKLLYLENPFLNMMVEMMTRTLKNTNPPAMLTEDESDNDLPF